MKNAPLLYFLPDNEIPASLTHRLKKCTKRAPATGPTGTGGTLISPFGNVLVEYKKESQRWQKIDGLWIGIDKSAGPEDFQRNSFPRGYSVKLGDENGWIIPVAVLGTPGFSLPTYMTKDENGNWKTCVDEKYESICAIADDVWKSIYDDGSLEIDDNKVRLICCEAIAVNYDLTENEIAALRILGEGPCLGILQAIVDQPKAAEILAHLEGKKKLLKEQNSFSGNAAT